MSKSNPLHRLTITFNIKSTGMNKESNDLLEHRPPDHVHVGLINNVHVHRTMCFYGIRRVQKLWNIPQLPRNLLEPKKEVQGVRHFLGVRFGSPMGRPFMWR